MPRRGGFRDLQNSFETSCFCSCVFHVAVRVQHDFCVMFVIVNICLFSIVFPIMGQFPFMQLPRTIYIL